MNCYHCNKELIWNSDNSYDERSLFDDLSPSLIDWAKEEGDGLISYLSCPKCDSFVVVYMPIGD